MIWSHIIRLIVALHFHVAPSHVQEIDYWAPHADDVTHTWTYGQRDCAYRVWYSYDVCLTAK